MQAVLLIIHLVICLSLICLVLLQRSEGGALGIGGGSGSLMTGRGAADTLARMTSFAGGFFLITSLTLTWMSGAGHQAAMRSPLDLFPQQQHSTPAPAPAHPTPAAPTQPSIPDPTQSSAPQAVPHTELASIETPTQTTTIVAPPPTVAAAHAAPVPPTGASAHPASATVAGPLTTGAPSATHPAPTTVLHAPPPVTTAASSTTAATHTQTAATTPAHTPQIAATTPAHTQPAASVQTTGTAPANTSAPVQTAHRPQTAPALTPIVGLPTLTQTDGESSQTAPGAVHRDHPAGPDQ